jgi:hypothetical protein
VPRGWREETCEGRSGFGGWGWRELELKKEREKGGEREVKGG